MKEREQNEREGEEWKRERRIKEREKNEREGEELKGESGPLY